MVQLINPVDASGSIHAVTAARVKSDYLRLSNLHNSPKCYRRVRQFAQAMRDKKDMRDPSKIERTILGTMKLLVARMRDSPDGIITLTHAELKRHHHMSSGQVDRHIRRMKDRGIVIEHNIRVVDPVAGFHTTIMRLKINVEKYLSFFERGAGDDGVALTVRKSPEKPRVKKTKKANEENISKLDLPGISDETFISINCKGRNQPGSYFEKDDIILTNQDRTSSMNKADDNRITSQQKIQSLQKASPSQRFDFSEGEDSEKIVCQVDAVSRDVLNELLTIDDEFRTYELTSDDLRNLDYYVHRNPLLDLRATVDRIRGYKHIRINPGIARLAGCATDNSAEGEGYLNATLPFILKNWGKVWKTCRAWLHGENLPCAVSLLDTMTHPEMTLNEGYQRRLSSYHDAQRHNPVLPLEDFLAGEDMYSDNYTRTPAIDRLFTMFMVGRSYPAVIAKYSDALMTELEAEPWLVQGLDDQGAPVYAWLSQRKDKKRAMPRFTGLALDAYARTTLQIAEAKDYGSFDLPKATNESQPMVSSALGGLFTWGGDAWYPSIWDRENRQWVRIAGQGQTWSVVRNPVLI